MAAQAVTIARRGMGASSGRNLLVRGLWPKAGELVALKTELVRRRANQANMFGGVGRVTALTFPFGHRRMCFRRGKSRTAVLMAFVAQGAVALLQGKRSGCVGRIVAAFAVSPRHGLMGVAFEKRGVVRGMDRMTVGAGIDNRIIGMGLFETAIADAVASCAEGLLFFLK